MGEPQIARSGAAADQRPLLLNQRQVIRHCRGGAESKMLHDLALGRGGALTLNRVADEIHNLELAWSESDTVHPFGIPQAG